MNKYTNPNPNFHIDLLKGQLNLLHYIKERKINDFNKPETVNPNYFKELDEINEEIQVLKSIIDYKELGILPKVKSYWVEPHTELGIAFRQEDGSLTKTYSTGLTLDNNEDNREFITN